MSEQQFHGYNDRFYRDPWWVPEEPSDEMPDARIETQTVRYRFLNHFHPFVSDTYVAQQGQEHRLVLGLASRLVQAGVDGLLEADTLRSDDAGGGDVLGAATEAQLRDDRFFERYQPIDAVLVGDDSDAPDLAGVPIKELSFASNDPYSVYNWELFYHVPMAIAVNLSRSQRFADAQRWLHLIFDPTDDSSDTDLEPNPLDLNATRRFWKVQPFQLMEARRIEQVLINLATGDDPQLLADTTAAIAEWGANPFRPFSVARRHQWSFMYRTVFAYLDNLIAWGDHLFRQDTRESINEATQLYVLAANMLGPRPQEVPQSGTIRPRSYADIRDRVGELGSILVDLETTLPFDTYALPAPPDDDTIRASEQASGPLYFCVPPNEKLLGYWDTVADRLYKIRNSLNIRGIFRDLPLFAAVIDPAMLARGAAAGLDISAVIAGLDQPLPLVRFQFLVQQAQQLAAHTENLGESLLSAIREHDNERLTLLHQSHQQAILDTTKAIRYGQWQEAVKAREGTERSLNLAIRRYTYYERLLGMNPDEIELPDMEDLDAQQLLDARLRAREPDMVVRDVPVDISAGPLSDVTDILSLAGELHLNPGEAWGLRTRTLAEHPAVAADALELLAATVGVAVPDSTLAGHPMGVGVDVDVPGGNKIASSLRTSASVFRSINSAMNRLAGRMETAGGYDRREQDWANQSGVAAGEIGLVLKQLRAAQIREFVAEREHDLHLLQIEQAEAVERFLTNERDGKTTNAAFYAWLRQELQSLHSQSYQLAFDVAKKAERALQHELGDNTPTYLRYNYSAGKEGLLAGKRLQFAIQQMETDYHDRNRHEYELTKTISLQQVNPLALIQLREVGRCTFMLPEWLFDLDGPHYFRRIKTVNVTIPAVVGRFTSVNCTLRLVGSSIRTTPQLLDGEYGRTGPEDPRFSDHYGSIESVVTSSGQNDAGLFQQDLNDIQYLPFEGSGVTSEWQLELPANPSANEPSQFDYNSISNALITFGYTARDGGQPFRDAAMAHLTERIESAETAGFVRMFDIRHEFPTEWAQFKSSTMDTPGSTAVLRLTLTEAHYPYWSRGRLGELDSLMVLARSELNSLEVGLSASTDITLTPQADVGGLLAGEVPGPVPAIGPIELHLASTDVRELWLLTAWHG